MLAQTSLLIATNAAAPSRSGGAGRGDLLSAPDNFAALLARASGAREEAPNAADAVLLPAGEAMIQGETFAATDSPLKTGETEIPFSALVPDGAMTGTGRNDYNASAATRIGGIGDLRLAAAKGTTAPLAAATTPTTGGHSALTLTAEGAAQLHQGLATALGPATSGKTGAATSQLAQMTAGTLTAEGETALTGAVDEGLSSSSKLTASSTDGLLKSMAEAEGGLKTTVDKTNASLKIQSQLTTSGDNGSLLMTQTEGKAPTGLSPASSTAAATTAAATPTTVRADAFQQVADAIRVHSGEQRLNLRLDPPDLGRVGIDFSFDNHRLVSATLTAENADTASLLRKSMDSLQRELADAGFEGVSVDIADHAAGTDTGDQPSLESFGLLASVTGSPSIEQMSPHRPINIVSADRIDARF